MKTSEHLNEIAAALVGFHKEMGKVKKEAANPFFKSKYASLPNILDAIREPLVNNKLAIVQFPTGENELTTILMHASGQFMESSYIMRPVKNDPQGVGSCITYQRRYAVGAILSLSIDEDDDGNAASTPAKATPAKQVVKELSAEEAIAQINAATSRVAFVKIWNENPKLHADKSVLDAVTKAGLKFPKPQSVN